MVGKYTELELEILFFEGEDVVTASACGGAGEADETGFAPQK